MGINEWVYNFFYEKKKLRAENILLKEKLAMKQKNINTTNSYWKGIVREMKTKSPNA